MATLVNRKHELFCQYRAKGESLVDAFELAGFARDETGGNPHHLESKPHIQQRLLEIRTGAARRVEISQAKILEEVAKIAFHNPADYLEFNEDGTCFVDLSKIDRDHAAAIQEITAVSRYFPDGKKTTEVKLKLAPKLAALDNLGRHFGMWVDRAELGRPGDFSNISSTEALMEAVRAQLGEKDAQALLELVNGGKMPETIDAEIIERPPPKEEAKGGL